MKFKYLKSLRSFMRHFITDMTVNTNPGDWIDVHLSRKMLKNKEIIFSTRKMGYCTEISTEEFTKLLLEKCPKDLCLWKNNKTAKGLNRYWYSELVPTAINVIQVRRGKLTEITVDIHTQDKELFDFVYKTTHKYLLPEPGNEVHAIGTTQHGLVLQSLGVMKDQLVRSNYNQEVNDAFDYVLREYNSESPGGRIVILNGPPGTGKTHLVKAMVPKFNNALVVMLPSRLVAEVDGPSLVSLLVDYAEDYAYDDDGHKVQKPLIFILEDADQCLTSRDDGNIGQISSLLNYTDGIFGSMLDIRIIATTNAESIEFDEAITRPGRLCKHIYMGLLSPEEAMAIYKRETGNESIEYKKPVTLAQVYADVKHKDSSGVSAPKPTKLGFT